MGDALCAPIDVELALVNSILDPVKTHVDDFRADLFASLICNGNSCCILDLYRCGMLREAKFCKDDADWNCFGGEGHDILEDFGECKDGTIESGVGGREKTKEEVTTKLATSFGYGEVGSIALNF